MELIKKSESYACAFKLLCMLSILVGIVMAIRALIASSAAAQLLTNGGFNFAGIGAIILVLSLLIPVMLILAGILGCLRKTTAAIVLSTIVFAVSLFFNITNIGTIAAVATDLKAVIGDLIPMTATTAMALLLVIYAILTKKHPHNPKFP